VLAETLGGERVLYAATAVTGEDRELERRVRAHRERRPAAWDTLELGGGDPGVIIGSAVRYRVVLLDSLTLWVSARLAGGEAVPEMLAALEGFLERAGALRTPLVVVSDEVGMGVVPESACGRRFRDALGLANGRAAAVAEEVHLCVAGIAVRIK
jgi:adenosylcobinamide kinase / adenosylcobinamide-phosphate guanylyltransferase